MLVLLLALSAPPQAPVPPQCPAYLPACACGDDCKCPPGACPDCPTKAAPKDIHVSPDGTVNELHPDGVYRPVPGAPKRTPLAIYPNTPFGPISPTCANGSCGAAANYLQLGGGCATGSCPGTGRRR